MTRIAPHFAGTFTLTYGTDNECNDPPPAQAMTLNNPQFREALGQIAVENRVFVEIKQKRDLIEHDQARFRWNGKHDQPSGPRQIVSDFVETIRVFSGKPNQIQAADNAVLKLLQKLFPAVSLPTTVAGEDFEHSDNDRGLFVINYTPQK